MPIVKSPDTYGPGLGKKEEGDTMVLCATYGFQKADRVRPPGCEGRLHGSIYSPYQPQKLTWVVVVVVIVEDIKHKKFLIDQFLLN